MADPVSAIVRLRRTLREFPLVRKAYYRARSALTKRVDPFDLRLVPEQAFRAKVRVLVAAMKGNVGNYVEFGVFNGLSISIVYKVFQERGLTSQLFYGFDSFEGTPPDAQGLYLTGMCKCDLATTVKFLNGKVDWQRVHLVQGWFKDTLTPEWRRRIGKVSLIMIDSDLYSSAVEALTFVEPLIEDEAVIMFDDWNGFQAAERGLGEKQAFDEFLVAHPHFSAVELPGYSVDSAIFRVTRR